MMFFILEKNGIDLQFLGFNNFTLFLSSSLLLTLCLFFSKDNIYYMVISFLVVCSSFTLIQILLSYNGLNIFFYIVLLITSMDIFAYIGGNLIGKIKIAPRISKGKTVEGTIVGLLFTILISIGFKKILSFDIWHACLFGFIVALLALMGDLLVSCFKRKVGTKDSGSLFPGHGGLLDRFDGYILVLPALMIYFNYLI